MQLLVTPILLEDMEALAQAGADGLIFGSAFFSARCANHVQPETYKAIKERCVSCGIKMYVMVNRFFVEEELTLLKGHLAYLKECHVDGIYFSDEAVLALAIELQMEQLLIYQPDTLLTNHPDVNYYLSEGCQSVVLSKEITLEEIVQIAQNSEPSSLELIGHGRVAMMHSKRALLSNYMKFIGKETDVKQNQSFIIEEETRKDRMPIMEDEQGTHVFSAYVLCSFQEMETFLQAGIGAMRIDGMFTTRECLLDTVKLYHNIRKGKISGKDAQETYLAQYPQEPISSGFYYQATSTTK